MADALIVDIERRYATGVTIAAELHATMAPGSIVVLFGPSGSGKTTVVRAVAGLERPDRGSIRFNDQTWLDRERSIFIEPQARRVGYVFQEAALFPHLTVLENVRYGVRRTPDLPPSRRGATASLAEARARSGASGGGKVGPTYEAAGPSSSSGVGELLEMTDLFDLADRYPRELSGGQAQRVALARALAAKPQLLLLDEPFAALDAPARAGLRRLLRTSIERLGIAAVLVTHDRTEAIALGDQLAVLAGGRIRQIGPVLDVFRRPADLVVAQSVGIESVIPARVERVDNGLVELRVGENILRTVDTELTADARDVFACIRAEDVTVERAAAPSASARNHLAARIVSIESEGPVERVALDCGFPLTALITRSAREELALQAGGSVVVAIKATAIHLVPRS